MLEILSKIWIALNLQNKDENINLERQKTSHCDHIAPLVHFSSLFFIFLQIQQNLYFAKNFKNNSTIMHFFKTMKIAV